MGGPERAKGSGQASDRFRLDGRAAVVTGAARGIGAAVAAALRDAGATVLGADVDDGADAVVDVTSKDAVEALAARAVESLGRLDIWVNVAGIITNAALADVAEPDIDRIMAVNLKGTLFGCQAAVAHMRTANGGCIVNTASGAAVIPTPTAGAYAMSKAAVISLTRTLAAEEGRHGIRVNAVAPGFVRTPMTMRDAADDEGFERKAAPMRARSPLGVIGEPDDIAGAVVYLASDAARFVTGQVLHPNGGSIMP